MQATFRHCESIKSRGSKQQTLGDLLERKRIIQSRIFQFCDVCELPDREISMLEVKRQDPADEAETEVIFGQKAIMEYLNMPRRFFYQLLEEPGFPIDRRGSRWVSHQVELDAWMNGPLYYNTSCYNTSCKKGITRFLGVSNRMLGRLLKGGLPVRRVGSRLTADKSELEDFCRAKYFVCSLSKLP